MSERKFSFNIESLVISNGFTIEDLALQIQSETSHLIICVANGSQILIYNSSAELPKNLLFEGSSGNRFYFRSQEDNILYTVFTKDVAEIYIYHCTDLYKKDNRIVLAQFDYAENSDKRIVYK